MILELFISNKIPSRQALFTDEARLTYLPVFLNIILLLIILRGNDVIVKEGNDQIVSGRFSYGPLDMAALTGEKVDIHLMKDPSVGDWTLVTTEVTDKHGRVCITLPREHNVGYGLYPVRMVVRGDHTCLQMTLAVVPPKTETVVFSIDGSFAASVSVTGKDPKVSTYLHTYIIWLVVAPQ